MSYHKAFIAHSPSQPNIFISNLDENVRGIFIKFKNNKMLNEVWIENTLGEMIKKSKEQTHWMKFNTASIKIQLLSLKTTLTYKLYISIMWNKLDN